MTVAYLSRISDELELAALVQSFWAATGLAVPV